MYGLVQTSDLWWLNGVSVRSWTRWKFRPVMGRPDCAETKKGPWGEGTRAPKGGGATAVIAVWWKIVGGRPRSRPILEEYAGTRGNARAHLAR